MRASMWMRILCLLVISLTVAIAVHSHHDGHLDCARHCPSCADLQASAPRCVVSVVVVSFITFGAVVTADSHVPLTLLPPNLHVRPPPVA